MLLMFFLFVYLMSQEMGTLFQMNIKVYIGIMVFLMWAVGCNWWYVCKIKGLCESTPIIAAEGSNSIPTQVQASVNSDQVDASEKASIPVVSESEEAVPVILEETKPPMPPELLINFHVGTTRLVDRSVFEDYKTKVQQISDEGYLESVSITGHTCDLGSDDYNHRLGLQRAEYVKSELARLGIDQSKININSAGETQPLNANGSEKERIVNRRANIIIQ